MIQRLILTMGIVAAALMGRAFAEPPEDRGQSSLETRVQKLEKETDTLRRKLASLEAEMQRLDLYKHLELANMRVLGGPFIAGDKITVSYDLKNKLDQNLQIPVDRSSSFPMYLIGIRQHWIERNGSDKKISAIPSKARRGARYGISGSVISAKPTMLAGESLTLQQQLATDGFPPGKYTVSVEYKKVRGGVIQTETVQLELKAK